MAHQLTAADVAAIDFERTQFRLGYEIEEVDAFMAAIITALRAGQPLGEILDLARFTTTRFKEGYEQSEVDELVELLRRRETAAPVRRGGRRAATDLQRRSPLLPPPMPQKEPEPPTSTIVGSMSEAAPTEYEDIMLDLAAPLPPVPAEPEPATLSLLEPQPQPEPEPVTTAPPAPEPQPVPLWQSGELTQPLRTPPQPEPEPEVEASQQDRGTTMPEPDEVPAGPSFVLEEPEPGPLPAMVLMTPEEVDAVRFTTTRFRDPYDMGAVDDFLDILSRTLRQGEDPSRLLNQTRFPSATRTGYRRKEVDRFLARLMTSE